MWKYLLALILLGHGLIHLMGFVKAFRLAQMEKLNMEISRPLGLLWLMVAVGFVLALIWQIRDDNNWILVAIPATVISQLLIISVWQDAKWGTIANVLIAVALTIAIGYSRFHKKYAEDAQEHMSGKQETQEKTVTENDLLRLPVPVQKYLIYCGVLGKPIVHSVRIAFDGKMRDKGKEWFPFTSVQYNYYPKNTRLFYMTAKMFGLSVPGYHRFVDGKASMDIRLFGMYPIIRHDGPEMDISETVTIFNDMCLLSPSSLIEANVQWQQMDDLTVKAIFTNKGISITAVLWFNAEGQLINFTSDDRYVMSEKKKYRFSTPIHEYKKWGDFQVVTVADAVWHFPEGEFVYGKFRLIDYESNSTTFR